MSDAQPGSIPDPDAPEAHPIPGIYNYCDRWCERCPFTARCRVFLDGARLEAAQAATLDDAHGFLHQPFEREPAMEDAQLDAGCERHRRLSREHPIAVAAGEYFEIAIAVLAPIATLVDARCGEDSTARLAVDTLRHHVWSIPSKAVRVCGGLVPGDPAGDIDVADGNRPDDLQSDANGSAKLLRLIIAESVAAWRALGWPGKGLADGVPRTMIDRLARLDAFVAGAFPRAMDFVRPGFDED